jgi:hypothetical protein
MIFVRDEQADASVFLLAAHHMTAWMNTKYAEKCRRRK